MVLSKECFFRLSNCEMDSLKEQRIAVKFCIKLGKSSTFAMPNTAYGDVVMKLTACFKWHKRFKGGRQSNDDDERPGRPSTSISGPHVYKTNTLVRANRLLTIIELAEKCGISVGTYYEILTAKLKVHRVSAKFVPRLMTDDQRANRAPICLKLASTSLVYFPAFPFISKGTLSIFFLSDN